MTDFKQLCAELLAALEEEASNWNLAPECHPLVVRAQVALAEPEPVAPTDKELAELYRKSYYECENRQGDAAQVFALRAVLARWGK